MIGVGIVCGIAGVGGDAKPGLTPGFDDTESGGGRSGQCDVEGAFVRVVAGEVNHGAAGTGGAGSEGDGEGGAGVVFQHGREGAEREVAAVRAQS